MADFTPDGQVIRQAVKWISDRLKDNEDQDKRKLVHEAIMRFDLSPRDSAFLLNMYK